MVRVVIGVIGNDIHVVAIKLLEIALNEYGFKVYNLGVNTKPEEFVDAALETKAHLLMISSINGEAANWVYNLRHKMTEKGIGDTIMAIGGNLSVGEAINDEIVKKFKDFGFDYIFHQKDIQQSVQIISERFNPIR